MDEPRRSADPHHDTPDGRTARRALRPRRTWPWPDLEAVVALVERCAEAGIDLGGPLRRLTWPVVRRTNAGFVATLVERRVAVPRDVVEAAGEALRKLVNGHAADGPWRLYAGWYAGVAPDLAVTVLQRLAANGSRREAERYRAWLFLHENFPEDSDWVAGELASDPGVSPAVCWAVDDVLAARDPATAVAVFARVADRSPDGAVRNRAAGHVERHDAAAALDLFATTGANRALGDAHRLAASRRVLSHDRYRGVDLLVDLLESASVDAVRGEVMNDLHGVAPKRLEARLDVLRGTGAPPVRVQTTRYLREHLGRGPEVTAELAADPTMPPRDRFLALERDPEAATPGILLGVVDSFEEHGQDEVRALTLLAKLFPDAAFGRIGDYTTDQRVPFRVRAEAVARAARFLGPRRTTDLYRGMAVADEATTAQRDAVVSAMTKIDPVRGGQVCEELARRRDLRFEDRLRFARGIGHRKALALVREFARDPDEAAAVRVEAAREAASKGTVDDRRYLRRLAATPSVSYSLRERLVEQLAPEDRTAVLRTIADSAAEDEDARLRAAVALGESDREAATTRLHALAEDRSIPPAIRNRARHAAQRLQ
ncbi:hypothetical protein [Saccharothrix syringae]|uniref:Uncharacterized protein n=1 Tax=Saccharothrix syringae TaxID=103733 RepID=A0A5Q0GXY3_SACSY|nr:hypothetical protein [Saccharothrix syringae]QFZ18354.1 hypothetical protein EKG83_13455 [Saccharothrix syringae]